MQSRIISSMPSGILLGILQFAFTEETGKTTFIAIDGEKFEQPRSKYNHQESLFLGHVEDYAIGD